MAQDPRPALLCITPAPAIDRTAHVERITHDEVLRPLEMYVLPGGKGVNAARAAVALGGRVITTGIAGGHAGRWIVETLGIEGLEPHWSFARAESRTAYVIVDEAGESVLVYERPSPATPDEFEAFLRLLEERLLPASVRAVVAGSIPAGLTRAPAWRHRGSRTTSRSAAAGGCLGTRAGGRPRGRTGHRQDRPGRGGGVGDRRRRMPPPSTPRSPWSIVAHSWRS